MYRGGKNMLAGPSWFPFRAGIDTAMRTTYMLVRNNHHRAKITSDESTSEVCEGNAFNGCLVVGNEQDSVMHTNSYCTVTLSFFAF